MDVPRVPQRPPPVSACSALCASCSCAWCSPAAEPSLIRPTAAAPRRAQLQLRRCRTCGCQLHRGNLPTRTFRSSVAWRSPHGCRLCARRLASATSARPVCETSCCCGASAKAKRRWRCSQAWMDWRRGTSQSISRRCTTCTTSLTPTPTPSWMCRPPTRTLCSSRRCTPTPRTSSMRTPASRRSCAAHRPQLQSPSIAL